MSHDCALSHVTPSVASDIIPWHIFGRPKGGMAVSLRTRQEGSSWATLTWSSHFWGSHRAIYRWWLEHEDQPNEAQPGGMPWPFAPTWVLYEKLDNDDSKRWKPPVWHLLSTVYEDRGSYYHRDELLSTGPSLAKSKAWIFNQLDNRYSLGKTSYLRWLFSLWLCPLLGW